LDQPQPKEAKDVKETQGVKRMVRPTAKAAPQEAQKSSSVAFNFMKQVFRSTRSFANTNFVVTTFSAVKFAENFGKYDPLFHPLHKAKLAQVTEPI
jgi:hypothetical protein